MLGINDPWVALAYLLCVVSALICVIYAWRNWDRGDDTVEQEDIKWVEHEKKVEENL